jgi:hypothetical protein
MLEKIKKLVDSINLDTITQGFLFILLLLSVYWFIPGIALIFSPIVIIGLGVQHIVNIIKNKEKMV